MKSLLLILLTLMITLKQAQSEEKIDLNEGVAFYSEGDYSNARERFERAYAANPKYARALYNAGNAAYLSGDFDKAKAFYNDYANAAKSKKEIAKAHFNIGNASMQKAAIASKDKETSKDTQAYLKEAIKSYKESLKHNPSDPETKYNLTYALSKLQQQQQQDQQNKEQNKDNKKDQDKKDQDQKDKGDKSDDNKEGDKGDENKENNDGDQSDEQKDGDKGDEEKDGEGDKDSDEKGDKEKDGEGDPKDEEKDENKEGKQPKGGDQQEGEPKEIEGQISRAQAVKDLDAINAEEGKILQKVYQKKGDKKRKTKSDKDW